MGLLLVHPVRKVYIKSIICHASGTGINTATGQVPNITSLVLQPVQTQRFLM